MQHDGFLIASNFTIRVLGGRAYHHNINRSIWRPGNGTLEVRSFGALRLRPTKGHLGFRSGRTRFFAPCTDRLSEDDQAPDDGYTGFALRCARTLPERTRVFLRFNLPASHCFPFLGSSSRLPILLRLARNGAPFEPTSVPEVPQPVGEDAVTTV